jgi:hypothetical protein
MNRFACIALFALAFAAPATAQQVLELHQNDARFHQTWLESEGDWNGRWTPANPDQYPGDYIADWTKGSEHASARLHIQISGQVVQVTRTQPDGQHCNYRGTFNAAGTVVIGTYSCDWARRAMPWRATIGGPIPGSRTERPSFQNTQAYLAFPWNEREGNWHGRWTPHTAGVADGHYDAHFAMMTESANADLMITIEEGTGVVHVRRTDPDGRICNYTGQIGADVLSISGHYRCGTDRTLLTWSAYLVRPDR